MAHKTKKSVPANERARKSFLQRYGMSKSEWSHNKRKMTGVEIDKKRRKAVKELYSITK